MIKYFILIGVVFGFLEPVISQIIENTSLQQVEDELVFSKSFLLHNNIKSISAEYMVKKDWQGMSNYGDKLEYRFDELGNLVYKKEVQLIANQWQTTENYYKYNLENKLVEEKTSREGGFWVKEYRYDNGQVVAVVNYLMGKEPDNVNRIELSRQTIEWTVINDSTRCKRVANNYGQPYLDIIYRYDKSGNYLMIEEHRYTVTGEKDHVEYQYNKVGWLESVRLGDKVSRFAYDEFGNVVEANVEDGGLQTKHVEYLYKSNGLLEAQLKTLGENSTIYILKYRIETYTN